MSQRTNSKAGFPQPGLDAAREGRAFCGYVNAKTGIDAGPVLTDSTFLQEIQADKRLVMSCFYMYLSTVSDSVTVEWVTTENADGTGAVTVHSGQFRIDTGAALAQMPPTLITLPVPLVVSRADGQALSARATGNDAGAALTLMFHGWEEDDVGAN